MKVESLLTTPGVSVRRILHDADFVPASIEEESCCHYAVNFVESGTFRIGSEALHAGDAMVCQPETVRRYVHREEDPADVCVSIVFSGAIASDIERDGWSSGIARRSNRSAFLRWRLARIIDECDGMQMEEWCGDLAAAIRHPSYSRQFRQIAWYAQRVEEARRCLSNDFARRHSLSSLAASAGMSPFHFARVFRELVGAPPHRYLRDLRLERARAMLRDGVSVTSTCYEVGFANLSHFIRSFERRFHCSPSAIKRTRA